MAFIIGAMAVAAGGQVFLGKVPGYYVIDWLPAYNFTMGILSDFVIAVLVWKRSHYAMPAASLALGVHAAVMLILLIRYGDVVAKDSIMAMTIRITTWLIIVALLIYGSRNKVVAGV